MYAHLAAIAVVVVIIIAIYYLNKPSSDTEHYSPLRNNGGILAAYRKYASGHWVGDPAFCERAGISSMQLEVGEFAVSSSGVGGFPSYLVINNDITNQFVDIAVANEKIKPNDALGVYEFTATLKFDEPVLSESGTEMIPQNLTIDVDIMSGVMRWYVDGVLYARFHKDNDITELNKFSMQESLSQADLH